MGSYRSMATTLYRIIKYGIQSFLRHGWLSIATIAVIMLALFVFLNLILFNMMAKNAINILRDKIDINVYFNNNVSEDDILKVKRSVESLAEVKNVQYVSRSEALSVFQKRHQDDDTIVQALEVLEENPLSASLNIKANDPSDYPIISAYLNNENLAGLVDQVTYNQNKLVINRLATIVNTFQTVGIALTVILTIISILVALNTIMLTIYSTRDEIGIMRLVGAPNKFIRGPYIVQGMIYGIIAAFLSILLIAPLISIASPYIKVLMPETDIQQYFYGHLFILLLYQLIFGIAIGALSSIIAVRKYMKI